MVILITGDKEIELEDKYADISTYFRGARSFSITQGKGNMIDVREMDKDLLSNYLSLLRGEDFRSEPRDRDFFLWMGHVVPDRFWKMTLITERNPSAMMELMGDLLSSRR
jgi:hypothetical protein